MIHPKPQCINLGHPHLWTDCVTDDGDPSPLLLKLLQPFSCIRFLNSFGINWSTIKSVNDWPRMDNEGKWKYTRGPWFGNGLWPLYVAINVCNKSDCDMYLNIPHRINNVGIELTIQHIINKLKPTLNLWLAYSNELWNSSFSDYQDGSRFGQFTNIQQIGLKKSPSNPTQGALAHQVERTADIQRIAHHIDKNRVHIVVESQAGNVWLFEEMVRQGAADVADVVGIAPYFGQVLQTGVSAVFPHGFNPIVIMDEAGDAWSDKLFSALALFIDEWSIPAVQAHVDVASAAGMGVITYEFGHHLDLKDERTIAFCRSAAIAELYRRFVWAWMGMIGTGMLSYYSLWHSNDQPHCWGLVDWEKNKGVTIRDKFWVAMGDWNG